MHGIITIIIWHCLPAAASGSGLSGGLLSRLGLPWLGLDIAADMLQVGGGGPG